MTLDDIKACIARDGYVSTRTLTLQLWDESPAEGNWVVVREQNARFAVLKKRCGTYLRKLHQQGVLVVSKQSWFEPIFGQQPTEYQLAE